MNFITNLIKIGQELSKLCTIEYFNIDWMGTAILLIYNEVSQSFENLF